MIQTNLNLEIRTCTAKKILVSISVHAELQSKRKQMGLVYLNWYTEFELEVAYQGYFLFAVICF